MKYLFILLIAAFSFCEWTKPVDLYDATTVYYVKDMFVEKATGIVHMIWCHRFAKTMNYWKIDKDNKVISKKELHDSTNSGFFSGKLRTPGDGKIIYMILMGIRQVGSRGFFDQWFTESKDGGETWSDMIRAPRENMEDSCHRFGVAMVALHETGHVIWAFQVECPPALAQLHQCRREPNANKFELEKDIYDSEEYNEIRPSIQLEYTLKNGKPIVHYVWANYNSDSRPIMHMSSSDFGKTFSKPNVISRPDEHYSGFYSLITTSSPSISPAIVGTYSVSPPHKLRLFYSFDHGETFTVIEATKFHQDYFTWDFVLSGLTIAGTTEKPKLHMLIQTHDDIIEYDTFDLSTKKLTQDLKHPFDDILRAFGIALCSRTVGSKVEITAAVPCVMDDNHLHMYMSRNTADL